MAIAERLRARCLAHHGTFSVLWHNSKLMGRDERGMFATLVGAG
jgi:hypothetical protein